MADNEWFADVEAALADSTDTPEVTDSAETASLEPNDTPSIDEAIAALETPADEDTQTAEVEQSAEATEEVAESVATEPQAPNWDSEENPHYVAAKQLEATRTRAKEIIDRAVQDRAIQLQNERIKTLADDDPQRVTEIQNLVTQAQQPVFERAQALEGEVEMAAKLATVIDEAVRLHVPPEYHAKIAAEVERMMRLPGGPEYLQRDLANRKADRSEIETQLTSSQQKVKELERRLAAQSVLKERADNGADAVESGQGNALGFQSRWDAASNFDEAFDAIASTLPH